MTRETWGVYKTVNVYYLTFNISMTMSTLSFNFSGLFLNERYMHFFMLLTSLL